MNSFTLVQPQSHRDAVGEMNARADVSLPVYKAGGIDLLDHLKEGLVEPDVLIDIKRLRASGLNGQLINAAADAITIDGQATLTDVGDSSDTNMHAAALAQACASAASPQIRNVATVSGNLLQRPRCWYYRNEQFHCLKKGGEECFAVDGENAYHAIFSRGPCYIVHPSNVAIGMMVLEGKVHYVGAEQDDDGSINIDDLYHMPHQGVTSEHTLPKGAVVTHLTVAPARHSGFYAIKAKQSFDWPLVAAAVALEMEGSVIRKARVCAGAVAPVPWLMPAVAQALAGVDTDDDAGLRKACDAAREGAVPLRDNAYKVQLLPVAIRRAVLKAVRRDAH